MKRREDAPNQLGELEGAIMSVVWDRGEASVHEVREALEPGRRLAYTTVMTVMSRLAEKGLLARRKDGRAYLYRAAREREQLAGSLLSGLVSTLYAGSTGRAIAHLLETEEDIDEQELSRLEELIRRRRGERR